MKAVTSTMRRTSGAFRLNYVTETGEREHNEPFRVVTCRGCAVDMAFQE